jgi:hypothetical protein
MNFLEKTLKEFDEWFSNPNRPLPISEVIVNEKTGEIEVKALGKIIKVFLRQKFKQLEKELRMEKLKGDDWREDYKSGFDEAVKQNYQKLKELLGGK